MGFQPYYQKLVLFSLLYPSAIALPRKCTKFRIKTQVLVADGSSAFVTGDRNHADY
jgi:hypothetical protein